MHEVVVNGRFLGRAGTGVERFATQVLMALDDAIGRDDPLLGTMRFRVLHPTRVTPRLRLANIPLQAAGRLQGHPWEQVELPLHAGDSILLNLCNTAPALRRRQVVVIHDAATFSAPAGFTWAFRTYYRLLLRQIVRRADVIASVSDFSSVEIREHIGRPRRDIVMVSEGAEHALAIPPDASIVHQNGLVNRPFVLAVGSRHPNKNFKLILQAARLLDDPPFDIVIVGGSNSSVFRDEDGETFAALPFVRHLGYVTDEQLAALYRHAMCLVFPSLYEGFGLPPLEAMSLGCPVIAADSASLPEVLGDAARYIDPADAATLAAAMRELAADPSMQADLSARGLERAAHFRWRDVAYRIIGALDTGMGAGRSVAAAAGQPMSPTRQIP